MAASSGCGVGTYPGGRQVLVDGGAKMFLHVWRCWHHQMLVDNLSKYVCLTGSTTNCKFYGPKSFVGATTTTATRAYKLRAPCMDAWSGVSKTCVSMSHVEARASWLVFFSLEVITRSSLHIESFCNASVTTSCQEGPVHEEECDALCRVVVG